MASFQPLSPGVPSVAENPPEMTVLAADDWLERARAHERRVRAWTDPHQDRASRGEKHPVWDFLFSYYAFRPAWLRQWHPGPDLALAGKEALSYLRWPEYERVVVAGSEAIRLNTRALPEKRRHFIAWLRQLLGTVQARPAFFGCHGLHEWAMVYRQSVGETRHAAWPLRFPPEQIAEIVEHSPLTCTHFDAFRFFTRAAGPRNRHALTRDRSPEFEQRGCLHANMDLYKWAFKLAPAAPSELVVDCFALARDIREIDMRASPYDLAGLGFSPIRIECAEGKAEYERHQRAFAARSVPLRARLLELCDRLLAVEN